MPEVNEPKSERKLSQRIEDYRQEAQALVASGSEHHCWEFKQEWSISQESGGKRLEFVKLVQGLANSNYDGERFLVIGASQKDKTFSPVANSDEFDNARVSDLLGKYLEPLPVFESFNSLDTDDGKKFVIIGLAQVQPRPIAVKREGHDTISKVHLRPGEVWIKRNTKRELASRSDLDQMYTEQIEREAESRARRRFAHFREEIIQVATPATFTAQIPTIDLILGPRGSYRNYFLGLLANEDTNRLKMLFELFRELTMSSWETGKKSLSPAENMAASFSPALDCLVESGLLVIKNDLDSAALTSVCDLMQENYEFLRERQLPQLPLTQGGLPAWQPAFQTFCGLRALAVYSVMRRRQRFLPSMQRRFVKQFTENYWNESRIPIVFWPFSNSGVQLPENQSWILSLWTECIERYWGGYFRNVQVYERAACEYELVLELNSWIGIGQAGKPAQQSVEFAARGVSMSYIPALWLYPMRYLVPISQEILDSLRSGTTFLETLAFVPESVRLAFSGDLNSRVATLGRFLKHVHSFHSNTAFSANRFPGFFQWEGALADAVKNASAAGAA